MPVLSTFYGITVSMYFMDNKRHHRPHIHGYGRMWTVMFVLFPLPPSGDFLILITAYRALISPGSTHPHIPYRTNP